MHSIYSIWYVVAVIAVGMLAVSLTKGILHYKVKQVVLVSAVIVIICRRKVDNQLHGVQT